MAGLAKRRPGKTAGDELEAAVLAAQQGDEDAFRVVYRSVQPGLLRYLYKLVGEDAEDVAAEAWVRITRSLPSFKGTSAGFRGWAATIARNTAMDHVRWLRRRPQTSPLIDEAIEVPGQGDAETGAFEHMTTHAAIALIAQLPQDQAEAVLLRVVMGLDAKSAARILGKRPGAVRTASYRGLNRLAELLATSTRRPARSAARTG